MRKLKLFFRKINPYARLKGCRNELWLNIEEKRYWMDEAQRFKSRVEQLTGQPQKFSR